MTTLKATDTLVDLRDMMFQRFLLVTLASAALMLYLTMFERPMPPDTLIFLTCFVVLMALLYRIRHYWPQPARWTFVVILNTSMVLSWLILPVVWPVYISIPVILISALLIPLGGFLSTGGLWLALMTLSGMGGVVDYPIIPFLWISGIALAVTQTTTSSLYTAIVWYQTMQARADQLLRETRDRRAELKQTLKSLDTAYVNLRRMQQQLVYARQEAQTARRMKERFAANISHELRTPLNLILGFSEVIYLTPEVYGDDIHMPPKLYSDIAHIYRSSRHLLALIDDVLDLSHIEIAGFTLNLEMTNLNTFFDETATILQNLFTQPRVRFVVNIMPDLPPLEIDQTRMRQILINLVSNAQRFTPAGTVTLTVEHIDRQLIIKVVDTGIGIAPDKLQHIYDEFFQADYSLSRSHGGAGLGLAITKRFVEAHNGTIDVQSHTADQHHASGTTFIIRLPVGTPTLLTMPASDLNVISAGDDRPCVLIVDSDPLVTSLIKRHIAYPVVTIAEGDDLTSAVHEVQPCAVIQELLPNEDLSPVFEQLGVPVIGCSLPSQRWLTRQLNVTSCLAKPVTAEQIARELDRLHHIAIERILIVDDDLGFVQLIQRLLETLPATYHIHRAYDGQQALDIAQAHPPDLILLDLAMPTMDGFQVLAQLQGDDRLQHIPVIVLTATRYIQDDSEHNTKMVIQQPGGLRPGDVLRHINAVIEPLARRQQVDVPDKPEKQLY